MCETMISSGYSSFLAEVNDLAKLNKSSGEQLVTQMENEPLRKIPKLSDNKKFLGRLRATRRYIPLLATPHVILIQQTFNVCSCGGPHNFKAFFRYLHQVDIDVPDLGGY